MVAYSFNRRFHDAVSSGQKTQTVRAFRKRHARVGEPVQLYAGMRTKHCRKLVEPDPVCTAVKSVEITIVPNLRERLAAMTIDGRALTDAEIENFALADGFRTTLLTTARQQMGRFWSISHGEGVFEGVLIQWGTGETWGA